MDRIIMLLLMIMLLSLSFSCTRMNKESEEYFTNAFTCAYVIKIEDSCFMRGLGGTLNGEINCAYKQICEMEFHL